jgi:hypothetical protein
VGAAISFAVIQQSIDAMFHHDGCLINRLDPEESTIYRAAHAFETGVDWRGL